MLNIDVHVAPPRRFVLLLAGLFTLAPPAMAQYRATHQPVTAGTSYRLAGARIAWQTYIPQRSIDSIHRFELVDEYIYALGTSGWAWSIDARTGERQWSRQLVQEGDTLWPPVSGRRFRDDTVAFTRLMSISLVQLDDGMESLSYPLAKPSSGPVGMTRELAVSSEVDRRIRSYHLERGFTAWMVDSKGALNFPPLIVSTTRDPVRGSGSGLARLFTPDPELEAGQTAAFAEQEEEPEFAEIFYFADTSGEVGAGYASDKFKLFLTRVEGRPEGGLVADEQHLYVATSEQWLFALDRMEGSVVWQRRLPRQPQGAPVLANGRLYVSLRGGGIERFDLSGESLTQGTLDECRRFLAEWPARVAMLDNEGRVTLYHKDSWKRADTLEPGRFDMSISNPFNDAVFVGTRRGELICIRPANSPPLTAESFFSEGLKEALASREQEEKQREARKIATAKPEEDTPDEPESPQEEPARPLRIEDRVLADPLRSYLR